MRQYGELALFGAACSGWCAADGEGASRASDGGVASVLVKLGHRGVETILVVRLGKVQVCRWRCNSSV